MLSLTGTVYCIADIENINHQILNLFTNADLALLTAMILVAAFHILKISSKNSEKSKLRARVIMMFAFLSICPTITITIFSSLFFNYGMKAWFNKRVSQALENSVTVAEAYLKEHANLLSVEALNLAQEIANHHLYDMDKINEIIEIKSNLRGLSDVVILKDNMIIAKNKLSFSINFDRIPIQFLQEANLGEIVVFTSNKEEKVRALIKIDGYQSIYLLISKPIDRKTIKHVASTKIAVNSYLSLQRTINNIQVQFFLLFILVSLLLVLLSIWFAIRLSNDLLYPIIQLAHATKKVASGHLDINILPNKRQNEISELTISFNTMTKTLREQRERLITAHQDLTQRHIFIQAVLSDLSSGVIVLDNNKRVTLINNAAKKVLNRTHEDIESNIISIMPQIANMLKSCINTNYVEENLQYLNNNQIIHLLIRASSINYNKTSTDGYIISFDDISKLVSAQKALMWSEVAKRIAHEIKNPITPIYLATERLDKHLKNENLIKYLHIIQRNVKQIQSIINEFTHFSRLPNPVFADEDVEKIIKSSITSIEIVFTKIKYKYICNTKDTIIQCDEKLLSGALDNILRNACEAISHIQSPTIEIDVGDDPVGIKISIKDNGSGFPKEIINSLTEPYVTTKPSGTGLGLAIVKKIIDEHNGKLEFINTNLGATVCIILPKKHITKPFSSN